MDFFILGLIFTILFMFGGVCVWIAYIIHQDSKEQRVTRNGAIYDIWGSHQAIMQTDGASYLSFLSKL